VQITTDAPVPQVGDRVLLEVLDERGNVACAACRRDAVRATPSAWPFSFGVEATPAGIRVRARLYRGDHVGTDGHPIAATTIDFVGKLPPASDAPTAVGIHLTLDCIGVPADPAAGTTCVDASRNVVAAPQVGAPRERGPNGGVGSSHLVAAGELRTTCPQAPDPSRDGMACVRGGVFFLGDSLAPAPHSDVLAAPIPERLVSLDSFYLDAREVTVGALKQFVATAVDDLGNPVCVPSAVGCATGKNCPLCWGNAKHLYTVDKPGSKSARRFCTYDPDSDANDAKAVNCVSHRLASALCVSLGKRLPTEAEWEYAASGGALETRFPWGNEPVGCERANLAHGMKTGSARDDSSCLGPGAADGTGVADPAALAQGGDKGPAPPIYELAGNVSEWTRDVFDSYGADSGCWGSPELALLRNPTCPPADAGVDASVFAYRGGSWRDPLQAAWSANRAYASSPPGVPMPHLGFRCAAR
jgi:formylglycine-generating enzyme required for sulfatase activity